MIRTEHLGCGNGVALYPEPKHLHLADQFLLGHFDCEEERANGLLGVESDSVSGT